MWQLDDPEALARERTAKLAVASDAARKKIENKLEKAKKELDKWAAWYVVYLLVASGLIR